MEADVEAQVVADENREAETDHQDLCRVSVDHGRVLAGWKCGER
jgi:hypothetical protein